MDTKFSKILKLNKISLDLLRSFISVPNTWSYKLQFHLNQPDIKLQS